MRYLATTSFSGNISMHKGEVKVIDDPVLVEDLLKAGYIVPYEATNAKEEKPKTKRKGKTNED